MICVTWVIRFVRCTALLISTGMESTLHNFIIVPATDFQLTPAAIQLRLHSLYKLNSSIVPQGAVSFIYFADNWNHRLLCERRKLGRRKLRSAAAILMLSMCLKCNAVKALFSQFLLVSTKTPVNHKGWSFIISNLFISMKYTLLSLRLFRHRNVINYVNIQLNEMYVCQFTFKEYSKEKFRHLNKLWRWMMHRGFWNGACPYGKNPNNFIKKLQFPSITVHLLIWNTLHVPSKLS